MAPQPMNTKSGARQWSDDEVWTLVEAAYLVGAADGHPGMKLGVPAGRYMSEVESALTIRPSRAARRRVLTQAGAIQRRVVRNLRAVAQRTRDARSA